MGLGSVENIMWRMGVGMGRWWGGVGWWLVGVGFAGWGNSGGGGAGTGGGSIGGGLLYKRKAEVSYKPAM